MKKILIADSNKASLVMTSEIFKDNYPGVQVCTAHTSKDALLIARQNKNFDAFIIDFDLSDLNGAKTASKIQKVSKTPVIITAFENAHFLTELETHLLKSESKIFLKKPLQADVVKSVCEIHCKKNFKFQKSITSHFYAIARLLPAEKSKSKIKNSKTQAEAVSFSIFIEECSLNVAKFKLCIKNSTDSSRLKDLNPDDNLLIQFQNPTEIEAGKVVTFEQIILLNEKELQNIFSFEMVGKIISHTENKDCYWIEFSNISLSKKIFEAVILEKLHEQFKMPYIKWYTG